MTRLYRRAVENLSGRGDGGRLDPGLDNRPRVGSHEHGRRLLRFRIRSEPYSRSTGYSGLWSGHKAFVDELAAVFGLFCELLHVGPDGHGGSLWRARRTRMQAEILHSSACDGIIDKGVRAGLCIRTPHRPGRGWRGLPSSEVKSQVSISESCSIYTVTLTLILTLNVIGYLRRVVEKEAQHGLLMQ